MPTNDLPAAAAEMLDLFQDALSTHVYSMEDGETPPIDCPMVASIQRMRNALGLPAMLTPWADAAAPQDGAALALPQITGLTPGSTVSVSGDTITETLVGCVGSKVFHAAAPALPSDASALPSPRLGDTDPMGSVWGPAAPGAHWLNRDQHAAAYRGWMLCLDEDGRIVIRAMDDDGRYTGPTRHDRAADHVHAIAETALPPYPASDPRVTYRDLCQRAVAIVEATAAGREG